MLEHTAFLYARPNLFEGMARLFDFGNTLSVYNVSQNEFAADRNAFQSDYAAIADDMKCVMKRRFQERNNLQHTQDIVIEMFNNLEPEELDEVLNAALEIELERRRPKTTSK